MNALLPDAIGPATAVLLIGISYFTSATTAVFGLGGGIAMLAVMAPVVPLGALIPVHGLVQLGSNAGRALVLWRQVDRKLLGLFLAGGIIGAVAGSFLVVSVPRSVHLVGLGLFVLAMVWLPLPAGGRIGPARRRSRQRPCPPSSPCLPARPARW